MLRALDSVSCDFIHEITVRFLPGIRIMIHKRDRGTRWGWVLRLVISHTRQGYELLRALGSASCDIIHETGGTICYGHWVLHLVISHTRRGYDLLRALGSASFDITHETGGTICCGHWVLCLVISHTRQGVRLL